MRNLKPYEKNYCGTDNVEEIKIIFKKRHRICWPLFTVPMFLFIFVQIFLERFLATQNKTLPKRVLVNCSQLFLLYLVFMHILNIDALDAMQFLLVIVKMDQVGY